MDPKFISKWEHLRPYGITILTGEACGVSMRLLLDLDEKGITTMTSFLGGCLQFTAGRGWNDGKASVMLPHEMFTPLAAFCLLSDFDVAVVTSEGSIIGHNFDETRIGELLESGMYGKTVRIYQKRQNAPTSKDGLRNIHQMSGRTE
jgi:hypothetical protein